MGKLLPEPTPLKKWCTFAFY